MPANLENSAVFTGLEKASFHSNPKERQCQKMLKLPHNCIHLTHSKVTLKIFQPRLQKYVNRELPDFQAGFRKGEEPDLKLPTAVGSLKKQKSFRKNIYFWFIDYAKAFDCMNHSKRWKILEEMGIPDHLTWLQRNLYAGQEATVRTRHETTD